MSRRKANISPLLAARVSACKPPSAANGTFPRLRLSHGDEDAFAESAPQTPSLADSIAQVTWVAARLAAMDAALARTEVLLTEQAAGLHSNSAAHSRNEPTNPDTAFIQSLRESLARIDVECAHEGQRLLSVGCEIHIDVGEGRAGLVLPPLSVLVEAGAVSCRRATELIFDALTEATGHRHKLSIFVKESVEPALAELQAGLENVAAAEQAMADPQWASRIADVSPVDILLATSRRDLHVHGPTLIVEEGEQHG